MNSKLRIVVAELADLARKKELTILFGAGMSRNSGIPVVHEFMKYLLIKMGVNEDDANIIVNSRIPFEAFMAYVGDYFNTDRLLDIFGKGVPNANHYLMAKLVSQQHLTNA